MNSSLRKNVPWWVTILIVGSLLTAIYGFASQKTPEEHKPQANIWTDEDCLRCHMNVETIKKMQSKRGNPDYGKLQVEHLLAAQKEATPAVK